VSGEEIRKRPALQPTGQMETLTPSSEGPNDQP
jgi:hypothetical protein